MNTVFLTTVPGSLQRFTTLLQSGFYVNACQGTGLGELLNKLPGFTMEYIKNRIETIFVDGLPVDTLDQRLHGAEMVIALSSAMPGLAGAIFRKGGTHASLRTQTATRAQHTDKGAALRIRIKLFNVIAVERGGQILNEGCEIRSTDLAKFLDYRRALLTEIRCVEVDGSRCDLMTLPSHLNRDETISLKIQELP